jgi:hypothetical protein
LLQSHEPGIGEVRFLHRLIPNFRFFAISLKPLLAILLAGKVFQSE